MRDRVYVGGTFDLFHPGHVRLLYNASRYGDVWVGVNRDEFAERYKRRPILSTTERLQMVDSCRWVSKAYINWGDENSKAAIAWANPRYIVHGDDWPRESLVRQMGLTEEWLEKRGIALLYLPYTDGISSTEIEERVRARDVHGCRNCPCRESAPDPRQPDVPDEKARRDPGFLFGCARPR